MITNIFLGLILGIVITSFVILNNKLFNIIQILGKITDAELNLNTTTTETLKLFSILVDRFNEKVLKDNEHWVINEDYYNNIITLLKSRFKNIEDDASSIYSRLNVLDTDIQNYIIAEHRCTRNEIKKQAKISSKINSKTKTNKSTK